MADSTMTAVSICRPAHFPRRVALLLLAGLLLAPAWPSLAADTPAHATRAPSDWPLFRHDSHGSGVAAAGLTSRLKIAWQYQVKEGDFEAAAVIADGKVYVGDMDGALCAFDLATGKKLWTWKCEAGFSAAAAVDRRRVYCGDYDGFFHCLDAATGKPIWEFEAGAEINGGPNLHGAHVLFGSQDSTLYCLVAATGQVAWKTSIADQIRCFPSIVADRVFLAGCDSQLHMLDVAQGTAIAAVKLDGPTGATPAVLGERVFFGTEGGTFFAVDWQRAVVAWTFRNPRRSQSIRSSAAVVDDLVVFGSRDKRVHALDPKTGGQLWSFATRGRVDSSPVIAGQHIFVASSDGRLYALDRKTGTATWQFDAGGSFIASPAVAANRLVIGNTDGTLYCFAPDETASPEKR